MQAMRDEMRTLNKKTDGDLKEVMGEERFARYQEGRQKLQETQSGKRRARGERGARGGRPRAWAARARGARTQPRRTRR